MANRRIEMHQYRQVVHRMRQGESDRAIAQTGLIGRTKCAAIRALARVKGWLGSGPLPDDQKLAAAVQAVRKPTKLGDVVDYLNLMRYHCAFVQARQGMCPMPRGARLDSAAAAIIGKESVQRGLGRLPVKSRF